MRTHTDLNWYLSWIALIALKYETPILQEFKTHAYLITDLISWVYVYALFSKINCFFSKALLDACFLS